MVGSITLAFLSFVILLGIIGATPEICAEALADYKLKKERKRDK